MLTLCTKHEPKRLVGKLKINYNSMKIQQHPKFW